jgi:hypothetical protein
VAKKQQKMLSKIQNKNFLKAKNKTTIN